MDSNDLIAKAGEIIRERSGHGVDFERKDLQADPYCTLALIDLDGYPTVSTITASKSDGIKWITFCTGVSSNKADRIAVNNKASICFNNIDYNITLVGTIEVINDADVKKEMWYKGLEGIFNGPEDPNYCVFKFTTVKYNLLIDWQTAAGRL